METADERRGGWAGVRERVAALRNAPFAAEVFGAGRAAGHGFLLEEPLEESQVASAEAQFGVRLPPDYRSFLLDVGAGGAGPAYGLFPLRRDGRGWYWDEGGARGDGTLLAQDFLSEEERARLESGLDAREPVEADFPDGESYRAAFLAWDAECERLDAWTTAGALRLGHEGCGSCTWLAVTGPERGTLWFDGRAADLPLEPLSGGAGRLGFRGWYLDWLDRAALAARGPVTPRRAAGVHRSVPAGRYRAR
ncbi:SMI1/KNR4 family protein [Streptomyces sp. CBMA156]|uniref:SMI1/KNR4 family protein n=1 Tax=Streptomyces sp. CBMA156 TaxID=1930280 RepID=UPI00166211F3|nr:SMI1/KNR4 family protein [Streptomyces sp. CBMA156]